MFSARVVCCFCFFFNDTATTEIYTLSLHDALPISVPHPKWLMTNCEGVSEFFSNQLDRKSTRLNSSHQIISYAVFCLKKKNNSKKERQLHASHARSPDPVRESTEA